MVTLPVRLHRINNSKKPMCTNNILTFSKCVYLKSMRVAGGGGWCYLTRRLINIEMT